MPITLDQLNTAPPAEAAQMLDGLYEHSPWIAEAALGQRPFASLAALKHAMVRVLDEAGVAPQLALIRAHPELAGKAMVSKTLTAESTNEQSKAGLTNCTPDEFAHIQQLNAGYNAKHGFPFILAVRGPRGTGLTKAEIIATFERRLHNPVDFERAECLRNIHRIAEIRLNDKFGFEPTLGNAVWDWHEDLARHTDPGYAELGQLTVTYLTDAHRACAAQLQRQMLDIGFDEAHIDAVGNVVGVYHAASEPGFAAGPPQGETDPRGAATRAAVERGGEVFAAGPPQGETLPPGGQRAAQRRSVGAKSLLTGSHYDTVRNGGKYDGRLGIFVPMACVQQLKRAGQRLPFAIEVVGFAEEEGQRYKATFLGSGALTGHFNPAWLDQQDADGITMRAAMQHAGLPATLDAIAALQRDPQKYLGFVEVHIEQGPVLNELDLPLGVVTSINASVRYLCEVTGMASHAGTTPMDRRRDAACAVAELALFAEQRAAADGDSVATVGMLQVPNGSINVVPGRCSFSLDMRAPTDAQRDALERDIPGAAGSDLRTPRRWPPRRRNHARRRRTQRAGLAGALGSRGGRAGRAAAPAAQRCRPRRHEAARGHAAGHALRARPQQRHQPQPARIHHQRRHGPVRARLLARHPPTGLRIHHLNTSMTTAHEQLDQWIDAHFDEQVKFLQELVRVPTDTPPGNNAPHAERTAELLAAMGLNAEKHAVPQAEVEAAGLQTITNLILRRRYGDGGKTIALNAHGDVVPPGEGWTHDPYGGEIEDGPDLRPRHRGQQMRHHDLHPRHPRHRVARSPAQGQRGAARDLRRGVRRRGRPRLAAEERPDQARPDDRGRLQLPRSWWHTTAACSWRSRCTATWHTPRFPTAAPTHCKARCTSSTRSTASTPSTSRSLRPSKASATPTSTWDRSPVAPTPT